jgi:hypothetical protein
MATTFHRLNEDWNAEPNAPAEVLTVEGSNLVVEFFVNPYAYSGFTEEDRARITFEDVTKYRHGPTNDEGWYRDQCRFSKLAPAWGEFYEIRGELFDERVAGWRVLTARDSSPRRRFLFYFRDRTLECDAREWKLEFIKAE